jgi:hypothetical protein
MGAFLALTITFSQLFHFQLNTQSKEKAKTEQQEENQTYYSVLPSFSIPAQASIELNVESFCLFEISFEEETEENPLPPRPEYTSKFFQNLFRVIISPNAP